MPINLEKIPIRCSNVLNDSQNGFTISLLVHLNSINKKTVQLLSIGKERKKADIIFKITNTYLEINFSLFLKTYFKYFQSWKSYSKL